MKKADLRNQSDDELLRLRSEAMRELMVVQFKVRTGQAEDTSRISVVRRSIARVNTELRFRERDRNLTKGTLLERTYTRKETSPAEEAAGAPQKKSRFGLGFFKDAILGRKA